MSKIRSEKLISYKLTNRETDQPTDEEVVRVFYQQLSYMCTYWLSHKNPKNSLVIANFILTNQPTDQPTDGEGGLPELI